MSIEVELEASNGGRFAAYIAGDSEAAPVGGIVLLQEIFGINANIRLIAERFAQQGYLVAAPDLFWRQQSGLQLDPASQIDRDRAMALLKGLDSDAAIDDAAVAMRWLRRRLGPGGKVGAVGYCLGGKLSYLMAARTDVDAAVSYYGVAIQSVLDEVGRINVPTLLHIAGQDHLCPPEAQRTIAEAAARVPHVDVRLYPQAGHGFARLGGSLYDESAARVADAVTSEFLERHVWRRS